MDDVVPFGSPDYWIFSVLLLITRGADFLSTWVATPNLVLEGNPIARRLGWRGGAVVNLIVCGVLGAWPFPAIAVSTTSALVAARNFQSAWLMRSLGEYGYRAWMSDRVAESHRGLFLFCLFAQAALLVLVGSGLLWAAGNLLIPAGVGVGVVLFAVAIVVFTLLSVRRVWRPSV